MTDFTFVYGNREDYMIGAKRTAKAFRKALMFSIQDDGSKDANHIHTVAYSSDAVVTVEDGKIDHSYPTLVFKNQNAKYCWAENIFSLDFEPGFFK